MFNTCSRGSIHRSLTNTGGGYNLRGVGFPHTTPRPFQPIVSTFYLRALLGLTLSIQSLLKDLEREQILNLVSRSLQPYRGHCARGATVAQSSSMTWPERRGTTAGRAPVGHGLPAGQGGRRWSSPEVQHDVGAAKADLAGGVQRW
jgi:hypothetical protein